MTQSFLNNNKDLCFVHKIMHFFKKTIVSVHIRNIALILIIRIGRRDLFG